MVQEFRSMAYSKSKAYEDTSFTAADSPKVLDIFTDLGKASNFGYFVNDGAGDIKFEIWNHEQESYGDQHTSKGGDMIDLTGFNIRRMRLTHVSDSAYRIYVSG